VERLAQLLEKSAAPQHSPLVLLKAGTGNPLFLVHPIGGNILCYNDLAQTLETDRPIYGLQSLGLQGEQLPLNRVDDMAMAYVNALRSVQTEGPYFLAGWSMGGAIAFEMAQILRQANQEVGLLALLDSWLFDENERLTGSVNSLEENAKFLMAFFQTMGQGVSQNQLHFLREMLQKTPEQAQIKAALTWAQNVGVMSYDVDVVHLEYVFHVFKANWQALWAYHPSLYPGKMVFFKATEEKDDLSNSPFQMQFQMQRWKNLSSNPIAVYNVPGNHYNMVFMPYIQEMAQLISLALQNA
jgi:thioesterase domain-containing protein